MGDFSVVVIGCSAGGIEPLRQILERLPPDLPAVVFVVAHHNHPHSLSRFLGARISLPLRIAQDLEQFEPGNIYVCPGDRYLSLENGIMRVEQSPMESTHRPSVNALFRSAADNYGQRVIGVLLSGALYDGSAGLWQIKKHGGLTIVQDPANAQFPSMPREAIDHVGVDFVLPAHGIADIITEHVNNRHAATKSPVRILIVEDESVVATNLQQGLAEMGYDVIDWVPTSEEAIALAEREQPDVVLMDINLGRGATDGIATARRIWEKLQIPIVYCTAHADLETLKAVETTENYGYVVKPFQSPAVRAAVELALARREKELR